MTGTVLVVGAGAAGLLASYRAAVCGARVLLIEKNEKPGKKIYITGKGRCNLTNDADQETFFASVISNPRFLYSAYAAFSNEDIKALLSENGCPVKTERGKRVFPVSEHASDVTKALVRACEKAGVALYLNTEVESLLSEEDHVCGVKLRGGQELKADAVILATGGLSYPTTGSTGDGYRFAESFGHEIVSCIPSLVSFRTEDRGYFACAGLTLKNVVLKVFQAGGKKPLNSEQGEVLFTHNGISGPLVLSASAYLGRRLEKKETLEAVLDLKPTAEEADLDRRLVKALEEEKNRSMKNVMKEFLPSSMILPFLEGLGIEPGLSANSLKKETRKSIAAGMKALRLPILSTGGFEEAVITKGGVRVSEIDPGSMQSKRVRGLFFAGEVIDVDALTGGFNLQIAWSTGFLAGEKAAAYTEEFYGI